MSRTVIGLHDYLVQHAHLVPDPSRINVMSWATIPWCAQEIGAKAASVLDLYHYVESARKMHPLIAELSPRIPRSMFVTSDLLQRFIGRGSALERSIVSEIRCLNTHTAGEKIDVAAKKIEAMVVENDFSPQDRDALIEGFDSLGVESVAIRSSAALEDNARWISPGTYGSVLAVTRDVLIDAVKLCFASFFNAKALRARIEGQVDGSELFPMPEYEKTCHTMSILMQEWVNGRASGFVYSADPHTCLTGHSDTTGAFSDVGIVTANYGPAASSLPFDESWRYYFHSPSAYIGMVNILHRIAGSQHGTSRSPLFGAEAGALALFAAGLKSRFESQRGQDLRPHAGVEWGIDNNGVLNLFQLVRIGVPMEAWVPNASGPKLRVSRDCEVLFEAKCISPPHIVPGRARVLVKTARGLQVLRDDGTHADIQGSVHKGDILVFSSLDAYRDQPYFLENKAAAIMMPTFRMDHHARRGYARKGIPVLLLGKRDIARIKPDTFYTIDATAVGRDIHAIYDSASVYEGEVLLEYYDVTDDE